MTPTAAADTADIADGAFLAIVGGTAIQRVSIQEVYMAGLATSSSPMYMVLGRDSTVATGSLTLSGAFDAALDPAMAATGLATAFNTAATLQPQRSATLGHLLSLAFNGFGGLVRWVAAPGEEVQSVGSAASLGELSLSQFSGGTAAAIAAHIIYEAV
jgi:hypothetical protein